MPVKECSMMTPEFKARFPWEHHNNKRFCPNPFWQPCYPWVAYAKSVLTKQNSFPIPDNVADEILSYFEWRKETPNS